MSCGILASVTRRVVKKKTEVVKKKKIIVRMKGSIVMFGYIEGHKVVKVKMKHVNAEGFADRLAGEVSAEEIKAKCTEALNSKGFVFGLMENKSKSFTSIYCFRKEITVTPQLKRKIKKLIMSAHFFAEDCEKTDKQFAKLVKSELKEILYLYDVNALEWEGESEDVNRTLYELGLEQVKGHDVQKINVRKLNKEGFGVGLSETDSPEDIKAKCMEALESKGVVYGLKNNKSGKYVSLYIFKKVRDGLYFRLELLDSYCAEGSEEADDRFVDLLEQELYEMMIFTGVRSVDWDGKITTYEEVNKEINSHFSFNFVTFMCLAIVWYFVFHSVLIAVLFALSAFTSLSGNVYKMAKRKNYENKIVKDKAEI